MENVQPKKPKTNWHLVIWPIIFLWIVSWLLIQNSFLKDDAVLYMIGSMISTAIVVLLLNGIVGSIEKRKYELQLLNLIETKCKGCGTADDNLFFIDYQWHLFLVAFIIEFSEAGKFCKSCATRQIKKMFIKTCIGCALCPPIILWAWFKKIKLLKTLSKKAV